MKPRGWTPDFRRPPPAGDRHDTRERLLQALLLALAGAAMTELIRWLVQRFFHKRDEPFDDV
jgi:hypothetical protein